MRYDPLCMNIDQTGQVHLIRTAETLEYLQQPEWVPSHSMQGGACPHP